MAQFEPASGPDHSGAIDWSDLHQRMHYILHLFRAFHETHDLFDAPFTRRAGRADPRGSDPGRRPLAGWIRTFKRARLDELLERVAGAVERVGAA